MPMSADPGYLTAMVVEFSADTILSALLIFLWLMQRKEKHALCWGIGQLAIMAGGVLWFSGTNIISLPWRIYLCGLFLTLAMAGYWSGTLFFIGKLRAPHVRWMAPGILVLSGAFYFLWSSNTGWLAPGSAAALGLVMLWAGAQLLNIHHRYRLLGLALILRGGFNLLSAASLNPDLYVVWFVVTSLLKLVVMLGLIYAVQDEIQQRYARTIDSLSHGFLIRDRRGYIHVANERCAKLLGFNSAQELIGLHVCDLLPNLTRDMADQYFRLFETDGVPYPVTNTATLNLRNGTRLPVELLGSPYFERGRLYCLVQLLDISERKKKDDLLYQAARIDPVTGYFNRHALSSELTLALEKAASAGRECAVLFIDLDKFKRVNDSFGHAAGDQLLLTAAHRLHRLLRPVDVLSRFGGDEFIVIIPDLMPGRAEQMAIDCATEIIAAMGKGFEVSYHAISVTASIGIACYPTHGSDSETLIRNADIAMYEAKKAGRGELLIFNDAMTAVAKDGLVIDGALRGAIAANEFYLVYQAITNANTGKMTKVEALLRWNSSLLGPVPPDRFIPVAEDSGMIIELGTWVLEEACRQMGSWKQSALREVTISINVSAWQLADPQFVTLVSQALMRNGLSPHQLELELTERVLIEDAANVQAVLAQLRALGVSVSLDDFGTGYSSLSYLTQFHLNTLKIDRAFVMDIEHSERSNSLVHAIIAMGHSLGLQLVAEGVETAGQAEILEKMGCHYLQGYHISRPVPPDELLRFAGNRVSAAPQPYSNFAI
ncbi:PAS domain S-box-containing protein/diguanylate cyclase (GGDEF) domain-containing protein [Duganella sacchari]|uniref:PAS domain S-box-containing protein/diguanylate cyclase (GGDEF) domain-containing protein n=2 Tax=Duganella sacchari TaxID=551987 RepID=A0A1M7R8K3_9BURK|nr:PAS domain S-box-containing protein/diguanylate cyclase (GGDEF) domain-containing protein [Duganella sacchari]